MSQPSALETTNPDTDGDTVEQGMNSQASEDRISGVPGDEFAAVRFFAVVEVGVDGVLQQVHHAIAGHDEDGGEAGADAQALGRHFHDGRSHQEAGSKGDKVAQEALDAPRADQHQAARNVGKRGQKAQQNRERQHASRCA